MVGRASKETDAEKSQKSTKEFNTLSDFTDSGIFLNLEDFSQLSINPFDKSKISVDWDNISTSTQITNSNLNKNHSQFQSDFTDSGICFNLDEMYKNQNANYKIQTIINKPNANYNLPNSNIFSEDHQKQNFKISNKSFSQSRNIRKK